MKLTQKNFDGFVEALNHRMTRVESGVRWLKYLVGYMVTLHTAISAGLIIKFAGV